MPATASTDRSAPGSLKYVYLMYGHLDESNLTINTSYINMYNNIFSFEKGLCKLCLISFATS